MAGSGSLISNDDLEFVKQKINAVADDPSFSYFVKNMKIMSYITWLLEKVGSKPVIVGGHAVEIYTMGSYTTVDVDMILSNRAAAHEVLVSLGFTKQRGVRHWYNEELALPIEIPDDTLAGSYDKILEVAIDEGFVVYVIGIEDLILDRARGAIYWKDSVYREWSLLLMSSQINEIDFAYLFEQAQKEPDAKVYEFLKATELEARNLINRD